MKWAVGNLSQATVPQEQLSPTRATSFFWFNSLTRDWRGRLGKVFKSSDCCQGQSSTQSPQTRQCHHQHHPESIYYAEYILYYILLNPPNKAHQTASSSLRNPHFSPAQINSANPCFISQSIKFLQKMRCSFKIQTAIEVGESE